MNDVESLRAKLRAERKRHAQIEKVLAERIIGADRQIRELVEAIRCFGPLTPGPLGRAARKRNP